MTDEELIAGLDIKCNREYFDKCVYFGKEHGKWETNNGGLKVCFERLINIGNNCKTGKPTIYKDFAPYSFGFSAGGMAGGLIFHGSHDGGGNGGAPTYSVSLSDTDGWGLHT